MGQQNPATDDLPAQNITMTDHAVIRHLREEYGIQATTCSDSNPGSPTDNTAAIAVQEMVAKTTTYKQFLKAQGFVQQESLGRGLIAWERENEVHYGTEE